MMTQGTTHAKQHFLRLEAVRLIAEGQHDLLLADQVV